MVTISFIKGHSVCPVFYAILKNKELSTYISMFKMIVQMKGNFGDVKIKLDFEQALITAVKLVIPTAKVSGCLFHLGQAIQRKIAEKGLSKIYKASEVVRKYTKALNALSFIKIEQIEPFFLSLKQQPDFPRIIDPIYRYFETSYIIGIVTTRYPPDLRNCHSTYVIERNIRTNNAIEGWHSIFQRSFNGCKSSLYLLLNKLIEEDSFVSLKIERLERNHIF